MRVWRITTGLLLAGTLACSSVKYPAHSLAPLSFPEKKPVLGIMAPDIRLDSSEAGEIIDLSVWDVERDLRAAVRAISLLRATSLFREVDFVCGLSQSPNVALKIGPTMPLTSQQIANEHSSAFYWIITLGIIPMVHYEQSGFAAEVEGRDQRLSFYWPRKLVIGWVALVLHPFSQWHMDDRDEHPEIALSHQLLSSNAGLFETSSWLNESEVRRLTRCCSGPGNSAGQTPSTYSPGRVSSPAASCPGR